MGQGTQPVLGGDTAVQVPAEIFLYLFFFLISFIYNLGQLQTAHRALLELLTRLSYSKVYLRLLACEIIYKGTIRYIQEN